MQIRTHACQLALALAAILAAVPAAQAQGQRGGGDPAPGAGVTAEDAAIIAVDLPQPPARPRVVVRRAQPRPAVETASVPVRTQTQPVAQSGAARPVSLARSFWLTVGTGF